MPPERVHPNIVRELGIADGDVAAHALGEALPSKIPEDSCSVD